MSAVRTLSDTCGAQQGATGSFHTNPTAGGPFGRAVHHVVEHGGAISAAVSRGVFLALHTQHRRVHVVEIDVFPQPMTHRIQAKQVSPVGTAAAHVHVVRQAKKTHVVRLGDFTKSAFDDRCTATAQGTVRAGVSRGTGRTTTELLHEHPSACGPTICPGQSPGVVG